MESIPTTYKPHIFRNSNQINKLLKHKVLINLTNYQLSPEEIEGLCLGLSFILTDDEIDIDISNATSKWIRNINTKLYFATDNSKTNNRGWLSKHTRSTWEPPKQSWEDDENIQPLLNNCFNKLQKIEKNKSTPSEITLALRNLAQNQTLHICKSDKSRNVVLWYTEDYNREANRQLTDTDSYKELCYEDYITEINQIAEQRNELAQELLENENITTKEYNLITDTKPNGAPIYYLPKTHKPKNKTSNTMAGRPIVATHSATNNWIDKYITILTAILLKIIPGSVIDTQDFINQLPKHTLNAFAKLVSADVTGLYPNIPWEEGILAATRFFASVRHILIAKANKDKLLQPPSIDLFHRILRLVLENSIITFKRKRYFRQLTGTAMGMCISVYFANTFMYYRTQHIIDNPPVGLILFVRFIDDIFYIFEKEDPDLLQQITNSISDAAITLENTDFGDTQPYLDLLVSINKRTNRIETQTYYKETCSGAFLNPETNHTRHTIAALPISQFIRLKRNASSTALFEANAKRLTRSLRQSGYNYKKIILPALERARKWQKPTPQIESQQDSNYQQQLKSQQNTKQQDSIRFICAHSKNIDWKQKGRDMKYLHEKIINHYKAKVATNPTPQNLNQLKTIETTNTTIVHSNQNPINALFSRAIKRGTLNHIQYYYIKLLIHTMN